MSHEVAGHVRYIDKTRAYYEAEGYAKPYEWAHFDHIPFTPFASVGKPLSQCRVGVVTTSEMARRDAEAVPDDLRRLVYALPTDVPVEELAFFVVIPLVFASLAAGVVHEINNPLAVIKTAVRIIKDQSREDDQTTEHLRAIDEEVSRIARILRDLLDFSPASPTQEVVAVNAVIHSLEPLLAHALQGKQIALSVILEPGLPQVRMASDRLKMKSEVSKGSTFRVRLPGCEP